jgi:AraC-like DNA-binding protein
LDHYALTSLAYEFLVQLLKETSASSASPEERFLMEAREFIKRNIRNASVASMAEYFGYGLKYFNEYFKQRVKTTPNRFIIEQRMRIASSLLVNTRKKISVVASEVGFAEDNYFSKVFKKYCGMCPAEYRERNKDIVPVNEIIVL